MIFSKKTNSKGFTIVELLIASGVFSLMLLTVSALIIQISRLYYKGSVLTNTQTVARDLIRDIAEPIRLQSANVVGPISKGALAPAPNPMNSHIVYSLCIGSQRITYVEGLVASDSPGYDGNAGTITHPVWKDEVSSPTDCISTGVDLTSSIPSAGGKDMLGDNMRLKTLFIKSSDPPLEDLWNITVGVIYGDADLIDPAPPEIPQRCRGAIAGSQWCAVAQYESKAFKRIND